MWGGKGGCLVAVDLGCVMQGSDAIVRRSLARKQCGRWDASVEVYIFAVIGEHRAVERGLRSEGCSDGMNPPLLPLPVKIRRRQPSRPIRWTFLPPFITSPAPKHGTMTTARTYSHALLIALWHSYSQECQQERDHWEWLERWVTVFLFPLASSRPTPWLPVGLGFHRWLAGQGNGMGKLLA